MRCSYPNCYYYDPSKMKSDNLVVRLRPCDYCNTATYHSDACKRVGHAHQDDWDKNHSKVCPGYTPNKGYQKMATQTSAGGSSNQPSDMSAGQKKGLEDFEKLPGRELGK
jgi:hypothetical protein